MHRRHHGILLSILGAALLAVGAAPAALAVDDTSVDVGPTTIQYSRFYPRKDGYKDTVATGGVTNEPATVTIRIYNSAGTRVKSFLLGSVEGAYSVTWDGRKKDGSLFPSGDYNVKHEYVDAVGNTAVDARSVVLSHKKVYWHLGSQTRYAETGLFFVGGDGRVSEPNHPHWIGLWGGNTDGSYAAGRYTFTLPSAHVYASLRLSIYGTGSVDGDGHENLGAAYLAMTNLDTHALDVLREVGYGWNWYSSSIPGEHHVSSIRKVETWVRADEADAAYVTYTKMKLTYKYGILDY